MSATIHRLDDYRTKQAEIERTQEKQFQEIIERKRENDARMNRDRARDNEKTGKQYRLPVKHNDKDGNRK